jgi:LIVCS family branched-chain amino acid:cation transporter
MQLKSNKDVMVVGFALFAMFFGAGNLIFPPALGVMTGTNWTIGFLGFVVADAGLAMLPILAAAKFGGDVGKVFDRAGKKLSIIIASAAMICIGPLLAIPRTAATTFEMGISPLFGNFNSILFSIIFFGLTYILTIKPSKVIDIIGKFLTPILLISLAILIIKGVLTPLGDINTQPTIDSVFAQGVAYGYQTMDALGSVAFATVVISSFVDKGYTDKKQQIKLTLSSGIVAGLGLALVYGGLTYLGATVGSIYASTNIDNTSLMVAITEALLGQTGKVILAIVVGLACLTTAVGLTSAASKYFDNISNGKLKYEYVVTVICIFSAIISNFGVSTIIQFSAPILEMIYPAIIVLTIFTLFGEKIKNDNVFKCGAYMALFISALNVLNSFSSMTGFEISIIKNLPFANLGFNWIVPVIIAAVVGIFIPSKTDELAVNLNRE